jgi:deazaflavin-dependent oxidoreductase (nitroreductase family)
MEEKTAKRASHIPFLVPLLNPIIRTLLRLGVPMGYGMSLLTVRGRRTGRPRTTPVGTFEYSGKLYLFATFGEVNWVRNLRAAGRAILTQGRLRRVVVATELAPEEAAPILKGSVAPYLKSRMAFVLRSNFDVELDGPLSDFIREARRHPVFLLRPESPA